MLPGFKPDFIRNWDAFKQWVRRKEGDEEGHQINVDYLASRWGHAPVSLQLAEPATQLFSGDYRRSESLNSTLETFLFSHCHENELPVKVNRTSKVYLAQVPLVGPLSGMRDCVANAMRAPQQQTSELDANLWISSAKQPASTCATHYDRGPGHLSVIAGCKKVWLAPPSTSAQLGAYPIVDESHHHCRLQLRDLEAHGDARFPIQRFVVTAGQTLFIPAGWWHQVESAPGTLAINVWSTEQNPSLVNDDGGHQDPEFQIKSVAYETSLHALRRPLHRCAMAKARMQCDALVIEAQKAGDGSVLDPPPSDSLAPAYERWLAAARDSPAAWLRALAPDQGAVPVRQFLSNLTKLAGHSGRPQFADALVAPKPRKRSRDPSRWAPSFQAVAFLLTERLDEEEDIDPGFIQDVWTQWPVHELIDLRTAFLHSCLQQALEEGAFF